MSREISSNNFPKFEKLPSIENTELVRGMEQHLQYFRAHRREFIEKAREAWKLAKSYRGFHVGCSLMAADLEGKNFIYDLYNGANWTPEEKKPPATGANKRCAERVAVQAALDGNVKLIPAIITFSKETDISRLRETHVEDTEDDVLHPCLDCRQMMRALLVLGILRENTILCNINIKNGKNEKDWKINEMTVKDLLGKPQFQNDPEIKPNLEEPGFI